MCFCANTISVACYISNQIFMRSILHLTPFKLCFDRKSSVSHLSPFRCKCFVLKCGNLDKFESCFSDDILLGYTPHDRSYRVFNLETNTVVESCDVIFDETPPYPHNVFECASDKVKDQRRRSEGGERESIKIPRENSAYILKSTRHISLLTRIRPHSYRKVVDPQNWVRGHGNTAEAHNQYKQSHM
jgi:hypothetical protein